MLSVGIRELKQKTSQLVCKVREEGVQIQVTYRGEVVALLVPVERKPDPQEPKAWVALDHLAAEIGARWPKGVSAVEAISEGRR
jgi:prevent-host-death family protein